MKKVTAKTLFVAMPVALALAVSTPGYASTKPKMKMSDLPQAVQSTIDSSAQGGRIVGISKETKLLGQNVYDVKVRESNGKEMMLKIKKDGTLKERKVGKKLF